MYSESVLIASLATHVFALEVWETYRIHKRVKRGLSAHVQSLSIRCKDIMKQLLSVVQAFYNILRLYSLICVRSTPELRLLIFALIKIEFAAYPRATWVC